MAIKIQSIEHSTPNHNVGHSNFLQPDPKRKRIKRSFSPVNVVTAAIAANRHVASQGTRYFAHSIPRSSPSQIDRRREIWLPLPPASSSPPPAAFSAAGSTSRTFPGHSLSDCSSPLRWRIRGCFWEPGGAGCCPPRRRRIRSSPRRGRMGVRSLFPGMGRRLARSRFRVIGGFRRGS